MIAINPDFVHFVQPKGFADSNVGRSITLRWYVYGDKFRVYTNRESHEFLNEVDAWDFSITQQPLLLQMLAESKEPLYRAFAVRGELFVGMGPTYMARMKEELDAQIMDFYAESMRALNATRMPSKRLLSVERFTYSRALSLLGVRAKIVAPFEKASMHFSMRCMPSLVEERTWSIRLRIPAHNNVIPLETQKAYEILVDNLSAQGLTIKDVMQGTQFDL